LTENRGAVVNGKGLGVAGTDLPKKKLPRTQVPRNETLIAEKRKRKHQPSGRNSKKGPNRASRKRYYPHKRGRRKRKI